MEGKSGKKSRNVILWVLTVIFLCYSLSMFQFSVPAAIISLLFTASLCPLIWKLINRKVNLKKPAKVVIPVLLMLFTVLSTPDLISKQSPLAEAETLKTVSATNVIPSAEISSQNIETVLSPSANELKVSFIDVGQGDSTLIQSGDHDMLIDAGDNDKGDTVVTYLHSQGIDKLDYVIGTHPHADHIGGLDDVINNFTVGKVIMPPVEHTTKTYEDVLTAISDQGLKITKPVVGEKYTLGGSTTFQIIAPNKDYGDNLNNWSIGVKITNGNDSFVMCGDAESQAEDDICKNGIDISANVLKLNHHGSNTSTTEEFLDKVNPQYAVISCGMGNSYGHPDQETMDKLATRGIKVFRTDEQGTIVATSNGNGISWSTEPSTSGKVGHKKASSTIQDKATAPTTAAVPTTEAQKKETTYVLNTKTKKFHRPSCKSLPTSNRKDTDMSRDELIAKGYKPCKKCNP